MAVTVMAAILSKHFRNTEKNLMTTIQVEENSDGEDLDDENTHVQQISISKILDAVNADEESSNYYLPPHFRCAAHTMNLIATKDADKSLQANTRYKKYLRSGFAKATVLWNKYSRSPLAADTIYEITGCALIVPCVTRWNSWFDAVKKIRSISEPNLEKLCIQMNIGLFNRNKFDTMDEYIKVMECMVRALDILQGDQHCFLGILLPTIITIQDFLKSVQPSLVYAIPLVNALLDRLHKRFNIYFDKPEFILVSISHPLFKLAWLESSTKIREARNLLKTEVLKHQHLYEESTSSSCNSSTVPTSAAKTEAINEMEQYLLDCGKTVCSLEKYRIMKQIFFRYNTALTSSAPVERLFSGGKLILSATRNRLTDSHFEKLAKRGYFLSSGPNPGPESVTSQLTARCLLLSQPPKMTVLMSKWLMSLIRAALSRNQLQQVPVIILDHHSNYLLSKVKPGSSSLCIKTLWPYKTLPLHFQESFNMLAEVLTCLTW
uniref:HAT C-terminal dimerisation domain-containing protein n=1 Tax=Strigamia maritima TaxID=126957 RepID=T1IRT9_STRMM